MSLNLPSVFTLRRSQYLGGHELLAELGPWGSQAEEEEWVLYLTFFPPAPGISLRIGVCLAASSLRGLAMGGEQSPLESALA